MVGVNRVILYSYVSRYSSIPSQSSSKFSVPDALVKLLVHICDASRNLDVRLVVSSLPNLMFLTQVRLRKNWPQSRLLPALENQ